MAIMTPLTLKKKQIQITSFQKKLRVNNYLQKKLKKINQTNPPSKKVM